MTEASTAARRRPATIAVAIVVALSASLALAGVASATKVGGGNATIAAKKNMIKKLKKSGVKVKAADGATKAGKVFTLPITGGDLFAPLYGPATVANGTVQTSGDIVFQDKKKKSKKVTIGELLATFSNTSTLTSNSGKTGVVFTLGAASAVSADGLTINGVKAKFAKVLKKALKKKFGVNVKTKTFGFLDVAATKDPVVSVNAGGSTKLSFAGSAVGKLVPLGPSAIAPGVLALAPPPPSLTVPVTGGTFNTANGEAEIQHDGGISLANCAVSPLTLDDPSILVTPTGVVLNVFSSLTGGRVNIADVTVTGNTVEGNSHRITGTVAINATAAAALNAACQAAPGFTPFTAGDPLGSSTTTFTTTG